MILKTKSLVALIAFVLIMSTARSQEKLSIDRVYKVTLRNSGPVIEDEQVKGYYFFYMSDKIDKKTNEYTLQILDANLNKIKDIKFQDSKHISLLESSFNGTTMAFLFFDDDQNVLDYRLFDMQGKKTFSYSKPLDKRSEIYFKQAQSNMRNEDEDSENKDVFDIPGRGFISVIPLRENRKYTYEVNFYSSEKRKSWTYNPIEDGKFTSAQYLGSNDSIAIIEILTKEKLMSKEMESTLLGINLTTGRKAFEMRTQDGKHQLYPMNISMLQSKGNSLVMGPYYEGTDRVLQDKSAGFGIWVINNAGKIVSSKYISWSKDISKFLKTDQRGRVEDLGYVYFHNIIQTEDGKVFAIGEGYKKVASAAGIATTALGVLAGGYGRGMSTSKMKVTDMVLMQLNSDHALENAVIYDKYNNNVEMPSGAEFNSPHTLALLLKSWGSFDYSFTQLGKNRSSFMTSYTDYEKGKDYKGLTFNTISYYDGKLSTDKINLKTTASRLLILPAKPGSVLVAEYFRKAKRLDLRMEKMN